MYFRYKQTLEHKQHKQKVLESWIKNGINIIIKMLIQMLHPLICKHHLLDRQE